MTCNSFHYVLRLYSFFIQSLLNELYSPVYFLVAAYATLSVLSGISLYVAGARPMTLKSFLTF